MTINKKCKNHWNFCCCLLCLVKCTISTNVDLQRFQESSEVYKNENREKERKSNKIGHIVNKELITNRYAALRRGFLIIYLLFFHQFFLFFFYTFILSSYQQKTDVSWTRFLRMERENRPSLPGEFNSKEGSSSFSSSTVVEKTHMIFFFFLFLFPFHPRFQLLLLLLRLFSRTKNTA